MSKCLKKGMAESTLAVLIITLISIGFIGLFVYNYTERQSCTSKVELCRSSSFLISQAKKATAGFLSPERIIKLDCPICVPGSSEEIKSLDKKTVLREIAEHLRYCWYKTNGRNNRVGEALLGGTSVCLVCSEFKLSQDISRQDLLDFLKKAKIGAGVDKSKTYAQYLGSNSFVRLNEFFSDYYNNKDWEKFFKKTTMYVPLSDETQFIKNKNYQVIAFNRFFTSDRNVNNIFVIDVDALRHPYLECGVYHYQKE